MKSPEEIAKEIYDSLALGQHPITYMNNVEAIAQAIRAERERALPSQKEFSNWFHTAFNMDDPADLVAQKTYDWLCSRVEGKNET